MDQNYAGRELPNFLSGTARKSQTTYCFEYRSAGNLSNNSVNHLTGHLADRLRDNLVGQLADQRREGGYQDTEKEVGSAESWNGVESRRTLQKRSENCCATIQIVVLGADADRESE